MRKILIKIEIDDNDSISTAMRHEGFSQSGYSAEQLLLTIGILENIIQQQHKKLEQKQIEVNRG